MEHSLGIVVLAAGAGTRMRSSLPKVLHPLCGRPALRLVLDVADALGAVATAVVLAPATLAPVSAELGPGYTYVVQERPLGTGHAAAQARAALEGRTSHVLVLYGDSPLIRAETAAGLVSLVRGSGALAGLISFRSDPPTGYGRVLRDELGQVAGLVEERDATPEQRRITEVNSGFMCFDAEWLWRRIGAVELSPAKGEYYLTDLVALAVADGGPGTAVAIAAADPREAWGINDRAQLAMAEAALRERLLDGLMRSGVTVVDPAATYIDVGVTVGPDSTLLPGSILQGRTSVGAGCTIGPHAQLRDASVGDGATVRFSLVEGATVEAGATIGPFAYVKDA